MKVKHEFLCTNYTNSKQAFEYFKLSEVHVGDYM